MTLPSLIAFGALAPWPAPDILRQLQDSIRNHKSLKPIIQAIEELPLLWRALSKQDPVLNDIAGEAAAYQLAQWATSSRTIQDLENNGNVTRMPLTIMFQIAQYVSYLHTCDCRNGHESIIESVRAGGGIQGFCIGLLSALAVASAKAENDVGNFAAVSVRLAFCVGAYVDLDRHHNGGGSKTLTLAVRWRAPTTYEDIQNLLLRFPDTYTAVVRDVRDITITVPASIADRLLQELSQVGASTRDTGVSGRYHVAAYEGIPRKILEICRSQCSPDLHGHSLVRSNTDAHLFSGEDSALLALGSIMEERADWYSTISTAASTLHEVIEDPAILCIGTDAIPQSVAKKFRIVKPSVVTNQINQLVMQETPALGEDPTSSILKQFPKEAIAVIGMSCKFAGADSVDAFWSLLREGHNMLSEAPQTRFGRNRSARSSSNLKFWGNFLRDIEAFDHGFFKKSSREAACMDPQQRILLEIAYETLESSGYFAQRSRPKDVGCYIGACAVDYDFNVGSHPASAYSATGTLRSFLSGKLSHYFGWSGPSLVIDTACSSSAVAIHTACTALKTGQCSHALAGGITLMTSPYLYENFNAAHFLSPTGGSKPFSADADGYCRGEGGGLVFLKRLTDAVRDNDHILSVIAGSAVNQNDNCVPITVPHTSSQGHLYERVTREAGVTPARVNFVEAHGTGTPVGDPIEMESIRRIFGGAHRDIPLMISSAKGNIGHTEGASGIAALIKATLQIENRIVPRQALFKTLNPKIPSLESDKMSIPTSNVSLPGHELVACVNNYGAAGSNAAMIIFEAPRSHSLKQRKTRSSELIPSRKVPIQLAAASIASLLSYCRALDSFCIRLCSQGTPPESSRILSDVAFGLANKVNQEHPFTFSTSAATLDQLQDQLRQQTTESNIIRQHTKEQPVILCFGGQVSSQVALDEGLWQDSVLLRSHLDACDNILRSMDYPGLYPHIFQKEPVADVVVLHSIIFSLQYACAKAWLDSGLKVSALIGHSFGQLSALCVSGVLTLREGLRLVAGRAYLMQKYWGREPGTMIVIEEDSQGLEDLKIALRASSPGCDFEIACFNGPSSHVVVSDKLSADELEQSLTDRAIRHKRLNVPYGFHSRFTEPLLPHLEDLASSLTLRDPDIPLETCTSGESWAKPTARLITAHTREPVYFSQAVQRLKSRLGSCTWLEAGSESGITSMVRRALGQSSGTPNNFVPMQLSKSNSVDQVVDATVALWNIGHHVQFWYFHKRERPNYDYLRLPSYAWEKSKHWLELDTNSTIKSDLSSAVTTSTPPQSPPTLIRLESVDSRGHHFVINQSSEEYKAIVLDLVSCPSTLYVELASRAVTIAGAVQENSILSLKELRVHSLLENCMGHIITLDLQRLTEAWRFVIDSSSSGKVICQAEGIVNLGVADASSEEEFQRYERLTGKHVFTPSVNDTQSESLRGNVIYRTLARAVQYPHMYRGVESVATVNTRVTAKVAYPASVPKVISTNGNHLPVLESFIQVGSVHAYCLRDCPNGEVFRLTRIDKMRWARSKDDSALEKVSWDVAAFPSEKSGEITYDIFVYDTADARLILFMLGVHFARLNGLVTLPASNSTSLAPLQDAVLPTKAGETPVDQGLATPDQQMLETPGRRALKSGQTKDGKSKIFVDICSLLEKLADITPDQVSGKASFEDLGVDSLMMIEVISELTTRFRVDLPINELEELTDINSLVNYLHGKGCVGSSFARDGRDSDDASSEPSTEPSSLRDFSEDSGMTTPPDIFGTKADPHEKPASSNAMKTNFLDLGPYGIQEAFMGVRLKFEKYAEQSGAKGFWSKVYPQQAELVCALVVDAYSRIGCDLASLGSGQRLPEIQALPRHKHLMKQLQNILVDSELIELQSNRNWVRTAKHLNSLSTTAIYELMMQRQPSYASETKLLHSIGSRLADCLGGKLDPLHLLFGDKLNRDLLADFYANSQMLKAATHLLTDFISSVFAGAQSGETLYILEVGAGTGGTTRHVVDHLIRCGVSFEYYFTDISSSLVSQAKRKFSSYPQIRFMAFDCDRPAPPELGEKFHIVISTNCIHATSNITTSTSNILPTIRKDGALCLLEFTRNLYWFDLVFGLLEGWWLFSDGRQHALANKGFWDTSLRAAGFKHVAWTDGSTEEAKTLRLICAFRHEAKGDLNLTTKNGTITKRAGVPMEEMVWKQIDGLDLTADIYFPKTPDPLGKKRAIALLIHGGGHFLFGRKDVPMKHIRTLIERGFLPVSIDYRLCPETNLFEGPMTDCCDALKWATEILPTAPLSGPTVTPDPSKVVSLGWSSGGQLSMSLGYTAPARGIKAPDAVFAMYPPSDMESDHWHKPCYPLAAEEEPTEITDILAGVREKPIVEYAPVSEKRTMALSLTLKDDRAKIILHMCWNSQTIPILIHGLPSPIAISTSDKTDYRYRASATAQQVQAISPLWHIRHDNYKTPTFMVHGNDDDWLPLAMSEQTIKELKGKGVVAGLAIGEQCKHAFDLFPVGDPLGVGWKAIEQGYDWMTRLLEMD
ncbi:hypothetical protein ACLMJK_004289 [Lecanora helva]